MFDTNLVVVGNVLTAPEWRRVAATDALVAHFRVASTARRYDRENDCWVDGNNLRVRVSAWRRLAEGVIASIAVGDPVIVYGRLYTRDWTDENDNRRTTYEMEAWSIGHDLSRGRGRFVRATRVGTDTGAPADGAAADLLDGALPVPSVPPEGLPGDGLPDPAPADPEPVFAEAAAGASPRRTRRAARREPVAA